MTVSRPLPKDLLKKMFLKVLSEHRPGGRYEHSGHEAGGIIEHKIYEYFFLEPPLSKDERLAAHRAVYELERDGLIMQDPDQSHGAFKLLTDRGQRAVGDSLEDMQLPWIDIDQILAREGLRERVRDDYLDGDFETAIFKAFRLLEESVRTLAAQPPEVVGADLMSRAFRPNGGLLQHPSAKTDAEKEALHLLMRSSIMWFKNPSSHRTVGYSNAEQAAQVLCFANLLLDMVEQCEQASSA